MSENRLRIHPEGLLGIRNVTSVRFDVMLGKLITEIASSPDCASVSIDFIVDEIIKGLHREAGFDKQLKVYVETMRSKK